MTKYDHLGLAARNGVEAALLARRGFTGDRTILEGDYAFWRLSGAEGCDWDSLLQGLGERWRAAEVQHKAYPAGIGSNPMLEALREILTTHHLAAADISRIEVRTNTHHLHQQADRLRSVVEAWADLRYCIAMIALGVRPYRSWYQPEQLEREDVMSFMQRVQICPFDPARGRWAVEVSVETGGLRYEGGRRDVSPVTETDLVAKFHDNVRGLMSEHAARQVTALCLGVEKLPSLSPIRAELDGVRLP